MTLLSKNDKISALYLRGEICMFNVENGNRDLINGLVSGAKIKEAKKWNRIYNFLKTVGIVSSGVALWYLGVTVEFAMVVGTTFGTLLGVRQFKVMPARMAKEAEDVAKQNLMLEIQGRLAEKGVFIDGKTFKLERTAVLDSREQIFFNETTISEDGVITEESKPYAKKGIVEKYVRGTDERNGLICWLKLARESVIEQKMLAEGNGYVNRVVPVYSGVGMLEQHEVENLPVEVIQQTKDYDGSEMEMIVGSKKVLRK